MRESISYQKNESSVENVKQSDAYANIWNLVKVILRIDVKSAGEHLIFDRTNVTKAKNYKTLNNCSSRSKSARESEEEQLEF